MPTNQNQQGQKPEQPSKSQSSSQQKPAGSSGTTKEQRPAGDRNMRDDDEDVKKV